MEKSEKLAGELFSAFTGIELEFRDLSGQVDFLSRTKYPQKIALEVTRCTNKKKMELDAKFDETYYKIESNLISSNWCVFIQGVPNFKLLNEKLPLALKNLENHGLDQIFMSEHAWWMADVRTLLDTFDYFKKVDLSSASSRIGIFKNQSEIHKRLIVISPGENWVFCGVNESLKKIVSWVNENSKDHKKLVDSGADERHEWIWINEHSSRELIESFEPKNFTCPKFEVDLNSAITDLWIVDEKSFRFFKYSLVDGWKIGTFNFKTTSPSQTAQPTQSSHPTPLQHSSPILGF